MQSSSGGWVESRKRMELVGDAVPLLVEKIITLDTKKVLGPEGEEG